MSAENQRALFVRIGPLSVWDRPRFSRIDYLPKADEAELLRFRYSTRIDSFNVEWRKVTEVPFIPDKPRIGYDPVQGT